MSADFYNRILIIYFMFRIKNFRQKHKNKHYLYYGVHNVRDIHLGEPNCNLLIQVISKIVLNDLGSRISCNHHTFGLQYLTTTSNSSGSKITKKIYIQHYNKEIFFKINTI